MDTFTPLSALFGGALIGLSAVILMGLNGRIAGISGILGGIFGGWLEAQSSDKGDDRAGDTGWRLAFLIGLIAAPLLYTTLEIAPVIIDFSSTGSANPFVLVAGGLCVGFGTQLGGGCTSGHGVCGNARFSARSLAATLIFMASGMATVFVLRHVIGA